VRRTTNPLLTAALAATTEVAGVVFAAPASAQLTLPVTG
jgi:hypothetical protein